MNSPEAWYLLSRRWLRRCRWQWARILISLLLLLPSSTRRAIPNALLPCEVVHELLLSSILWRNGVKIWHSTALYFSRAGIRGILVVLHNPVRHGMTNRTIRTAGRANVPRCLLQLISGQRLGVCHGLAVHVATFRSAQLVDVQHVVERLSVQSQVKVLVAAIHGGVVRTCLGSSRGQISHQLHHVVAGTRKGKVCRKRILSNGSAGEVNLSTVQKDSALPARQTPK